MFDRFDEKSMRSALGACGEGLELRVLSCTESTNARAREAAVKGAQAPLLIAAAEQTAGRGRLGRSFYSPKGSGVYVSLLLPVSGAPESAVSLTCAASVAVMRAIRKTTGKQTAIKWVNDLYWEGKKACGILCEAVSLGEDHYLIVGIGINLRPCKFPRELEEIAGSLSDRSTPRCELIAAIVKELMPYLREPSDRGWLNDYREHSMVIGRAVCWGQGELTQEGIAEGINQDGELLVRDRQGALAVLRTGEISLRVK